MILCIETATSVCSVALCSRDKVVSLREETSGRSHASLLTLFIDELLREQKIKAEELEAVAVSKGPGSFTGLRIGVSTAKGIAYGAEIPLIGIDTLTSMFHGFISASGEKYTEKGETLFCPMIDARRMEVYYSVFDSKGEMIREITAEIISAGSFADIPAGKTLIFFGDGAGKCEGVIKRPDIIFAPEYRISASHMLKPAFSALKNRVFENSAYFEPFYLKDFIATKQKKNIL